MSHAHAAVEFRARDAKRILSADDSVITDSFLTINFYFLSTIGLRHCGIGAAGTNGAEVDDATPASVEHGR